MLINSMEGIPFTTYMYYHLVHFKYLTILFVNSISVKLGEITNNNNNNNKKTNRETKHHPTHIGR